MSSVRQLHNRAMDFVDRGLSERARGNTDRAIGMFRQALENELAAIDNLSTHSGLSWSILLRSAATMALDCEDFRMAEKLASTALAGDPHPEIVNELRDVWEQANSYRHLELKGVELAPDEMQLSLWGGDVGWGLVRFSEFTARIENLSKLISRIVERMHGRPFRQRGRMPKEVSEMSDLFVSAARAGSFAVTVKLSSPIKQRTSREESNTSEIVNEFMDLMELVNSSRIEAIQERIQDPAYFRNFLELASKIAPDGDRVRQVGFTSIRQREQRSVEFIRRSDEIKSLATNLASGKKPAVPQPLIGMLLSADATGANNDRIKIVDSDSRTHQVHVPKRQIEDIVGPLWGSRVSITWSRLGGRMVLEEIKSL